MKTTTHIINTYLNEYIAAQIPPFYRDHNELIHDFEMFPSTYWNERDLERYRVTSNVEKTGKLTYLLCKWHVV